MHRSRLAAIVIDCQGPELDRNARFWAEALGTQLEPNDQPDSIYRGLEMPDNQLRVLVQQVEHPSRVHIDIETDDVEAEVRRLEALGATRIAQVKSWWVMQAPSGQRFCVVRPQRPDFADQARVWR